MFKVSGCRIKILRYLLTARLHSSPVGQVGQGRYTDPEKSFILTFHSDINLKANFGWSLN